MCASQAGCCCHSSRLWSATRTLWTGERVIGSRSDTWCSRLLCMRFPPCVATGEPHSCGASGGLPGPRMYVFRLARPSAQELVHHGAADVRSALWILLVVHRLSLQVSLAHPHFCRFVGILAVVLRDAIQSCFSTVSPICLFSGPC